ncbi:hypothetical protein DL93DRAFT_2166571 [Clavulina sp. PMI_390]|nr:hypothetical protein DL93DRAFT_2166571 [Clavulina sp. PMI_390]
MPPYSPKLSTALSDDQTTAVASDPSRPAIAKLRDGSWKDSSNVRQWAAGVSKDSDVLSSSDTYIVTQQPLGDVMSVGIETKLPSLKRLYYRLYNELPSQPPIASSHMVDASDPTLGYVYADHIPPPYTVVSIVNFICGAEGITQPCQLFLPGSEDKSAKLDTTLKLFKAKSPGSSPDAPLRIVILSSQSISSTGGYHTTSTTAPQVRAKTPSQPGRIQSFCHHICVGTYSCCYIGWWGMCMCMLCNGHCEAALEQCGCPNAVDQC